MLPRLKISLTLMMLAPFAAANAQQLPDASVLYPETAPRLAPPQPSPSFNLDGAALPRTTAPGGETFALKEIKFQGNTKLSAEQLASLVEPYLGKPVDLAGLQEIANGVTSYYRAAGYPFARAYLPRQDVANGVITMNIVEGRYGEVSATIEKNGVQAPDREAQAYLTSLKKGNVISAAEIERIALIMNDLPGYTAVPIVRPGAEVGSGDLEVRLVESQRTRASIGLDNHGSRYTGLYRARADVARAHNLMLGDELRVTGLLTDGDTGLVALGYAMPLMPNGLRLDLSAVHSSYQLSGDWMTGAGFKGKADILGALVSYPLVRSQMFNLTLSGGLQNKRYTNEIGTRERYNINTLPLAVNFDVRDYLNGGAVTFGALTATAARVGSDNLPFASRDDSFRKVNLDIARIQRVTDRLQASVKASGQHTNDNIDATEFLPISGPSAVRAFPVGEFSGHRGWSAQTELAYNLPQYNVSPYVFYDKGHASNLTTTLKRTLSGYGVGARYNNGGWTVDVMAAWADSGSPSQVEPNERGARIWASIIKRF